MYIIKDGLRLKADWINLKACFKERGIDNKFNNY